MILAITTSGDGTIDRIVSKIPKNIFRLNFDQLAEFKLFLTPNEWKITNPAGLEISSSTASAAIWWKAFAADPHNTDAYTNAEFRYIVREIYAWFERQNKVKGNSPLFAHRWGKLAVLGVAQKYFDVPKSVVSISGLGENFVDTNSRIVKSLSSELVAPQKAFFTTDVSGRTLSKDFPWFIQEKISAIADVTVFNVGSIFYGFQRSRSNLKGLDWRAEQNFDRHDEWEPFELSAHDHHSLMKLCEELEVSWGRHDFMLKSDETLSYLEFNANGQWVFLDVTNRHGLVESVVQYLCE